jgi:hypothetical protein
MREAQVRTLGARMVRKQVGAILDGRELSDGAKAVAMRAVASSVVRKEDMHPNLEVMIDEVVARVGHLQVPALDDPKEFVRALAELTPEEQAPILAILEVASIVDGRLDRGERKLLEEAQRRCGRETDLRRVKTLLHDFVRGVDSTAEAV